LPDPFPDDGKTSTVGRPVSPTEFRLMIEPTTGAWIEREFHYPIRVFYEDTDFSGFVYHASYVRFFERGRSEALRAAGVTHTDLANLEPPSGLVVRRMVVDYRQPCKIDDIVTIKSRFVSARGARIVAHQVMERAGDVMATAEIEAALISFDGRPRKIPADLAAKLAPWLQDRP
jgi:acyl-CoA thioester hydrolase